MKCFINLTKSVLGRPHEKLLRLSTDFDHKIFHLVVRWDDLRIEHTRFRAKVLNKIMALKVDGHHQKPENQKSSEEDD